MTGSAHELDGEAFGARRLRLLPVCRPEFEADRRKLRGDDERATDVDCVERSQ
jgi:hypothetical protein